MALTLWRFSRPHTIIATALSVVALYVVAADALAGLAVGDGAGDLLATLVAALCVNVAIVGVNQLTDVGIDRINKPFLPVASGELSWRAAAWVVAVASVVPLVLALTQGALETAAVAAALAVGYAYSVPPLRLKRFPALASLSISGVRAVVVNLGVYAHFALAHAGEVSVAPAVWALTLFVLPFSLAIAILKDVPDIDGDRRFSIATFSVRLGPERVVRIGMAALTAGYLAMAVAGPLLVDEVDGGLLSAGHLAALALLWAWRRGVDVRSPAAFTIFYLRVWKLFFLEYVLVAAAALA